MIVSEATRDKCMSDRHLLDLCRQQALWEKSDGFREAFNKFDAENANRFKSEAVAYISLNYGITNSDEAGILITHLIQKFKEEPAFI